MSDGGSRVDGTETGGQRLPAALSDDVVVLRPWRPSDASFMG